MALSGNFISFQSILESVYRRVGYQKIDVNEVVETIGETLRLIGLLPTFRDVDTNGLNGNPSPLVVSNFRVALPADYISLHAIRKVQLVDDVDEQGNQIQRINSFYPMTYATDIFYKSTFTQNNYGDITPGVYDSTENLIVYSITLVGSSGTLNISDTGNLTRTVTFDTDLITTASNFVTAYAADYALVGITLTSDGADIIFTQVGTATVELPNVTNTSGDLNGLVERNDEVGGPVIVQAPSYQFHEEYVYTYKIDNGYIYTNFEDGIIELVYNAFVTDDDGFPMIPDDQRFIEAIKWTIIEFIDYKKWRIGEISDKVYQDTEQKKAFYIKSAISKASLPSLDEMKALKNMMLRSIKKVNEDEAYFKYSNVQEKVYVNNPKYIYRRTQ